jgi:hypothetical protein
MAEFVFRARYFNFWQGHTAALIRKLQSFSLLVLVALAIASGVEGSDYSDPSSITLAQNLSKAYSIICNFPASVCREIRT